MFIGNLLLMIEEGYIILCKKNVLYYWFVYNNFCKLIWYCLFVVWIFVFWVYIEELLFFLIDYEDMYCNFVFGIFKDKC